MTRSGSCPLHALVVLALSAIGCEPLPSLEGRTASHADSDTADTRLGRAVTPIARAHPGLSGSVPLTNPRAAFAARELLADAAERTLDVQYYIWWPDLSGTLLLERLWRAAERGVRVRLLLDDHHGAKIAGLLTTLEAHPKIEVRLFNPYRFRRLRLLDYLLDFGRINRRMHNKSFTADNQVTIVGGRNIGDEYFGADQSLSFADLDLFTVGAVVPEVSRDFDRYWASEAAYPLERLHDSGGATPEELGARARSAERDAAAAAYLRALAELPFVRDLLAGRLALVWAPTRLVSDDPGKVLGRDDTETGVWPEVRAMLRAAQREVRLISPYFVPAERGAALLEELTARDVDVAVLTNALEATDVAAVHAGYAKRRVALLTGGVALYELKRTGLRSAPSKRLPSGSSASSLHAKTFSVDGERLFVGSFNFDPRSARLNTELGFLIESPSLAQSLNQAAGAELVRGAYALRLTADRDLQWIERRGDSVIVHEEEPNTSVWKRAFVALLTPLPFEWLL